MTDRSSRIFARRLLASVAAVGLGAVGLVFAGTAAQAAPKKVQLTATVNGGHAYVGQPAIVGFNVKNVWKSSDLHSFAIVLPNGVSSPVALGVTGPGNWSETLKPCGKVPNCSSLLVVKSGTPRSQSKLRPNDSLTASVSLIGNAAGPLKFNAIKYEGDDFDEDGFRVLDSTTITVENRAVGAFCVTPSTAGPYTAGASVTFTVQAIQAGSFTGSPCTGTAIGYSGPKNVRVYLTTDDGTGDPRITSPDNSATLVSQTTPSDFIYSFPTSTSGTFTFQATFHTAITPQSFAVSEVTPGVASGDSGPFTVKPGPATQIVLDSVADHANPSLGTALTAGAQFDTTFHVLDTYGNVASADAGQVTLNVGAPGVFTPLAPSTATSLGVEGTLSGAFDSAATNAPITVTLATPTVNSNQIFANFAAASTGSAILVPGASATITSSGYATNPDGTPNCALDNTNPACISAGFPNGANGNVSLTLISCADAGATQGQCANQSGAIVANISAILKDANGNSLYSAESPASLTYVCANERCPWTFHKDDSYIYNAWEENVEDFEHFPLFAEDASNPGVVYQVPSCQLNPQERTPQPVATQVTGGQRSCVDVASMSRNTTTGDLSFRILWYDDYKLIP